MTRLQQLHTEMHQSPWLDNLKRGYITSGELQRWVDRGVRGLTSNPTIFQKAIADEPAYDDQFKELIDSGTSVEDSYWDLVTTDIEDALRILRPVFDQSDGEDGFVSIEVAPSLARDTAGTTAAARKLHQLIDEPNLYVKIPATAEGLPSIQQIITDGKSVNITLLFSLERYGEVIEAYLAGLEARAGDLSNISSVASFFVSRVDTEIDKRLEQNGSEQALALRGKAAVANAQLAYKLFGEKFSGPRWEALAARGARLQRPLWASTSVKNEAYADTLYVDELIGPNTVNTMPEATLDAFEDHGTLARVVDQDLDAARQHLDDLADVDIDLVAVTRQLEEEGVSSFSKSFDDLMTTLGSKADDLADG
ncbi:MAG: transaldolase [Actinomycetota bacterium]|nr:transaldolase [Actinomycetota bacterium]